jgi:uncharacterized protein YbjT (DUF2867 family)
MQKSRQQEAAMDARGKTIVVTGATGNQGGATARHLLADGWHVRALVRDDPGHYLGQAVEITGDRLTAPQIADALSVAAGRPRRAHPGLMDFTVWLNRTGQARLLAQMESTPA